jgi:ribosomal protein S17E
MNLISIELQIFLGESLSPQNFIGQRLTPDEFDKWNAFLITEIAGIKRLASNLEDATSKKRRTEIVGLITRLVKLSNTVNAFLYKFLPVWRNHQQASQIKMQYLNVCGTLEELISSLTDMYPFAKQYVRITNYLLPQIKMALRRRFGLLTNHLERSNIHTELSGLLIFAVGQIINQVDLTTKMEEYITKLIDLILDQTGIDNHHLERLLIMNDFNAPEFFHYCIGKWRTDLTEQMGLFEQQEYILKEKDLLFNVHLEKGLTMPVKGSILYDDLNNFLSEKYLHVKEMVKIRRQAFQDSTQVTRGTRVLINLPVPQIGLFIRMQIEKGWLGKEHIGELFTFFANHFYTPHTLFMSAESLQKKSTDVEFSTAQKMKAHLISMINWLNTHYNLSNYN